MYSQIVHNTNMRMHYTHDIAYQVTHPEHRFAIDIIHFWDFGRADNTYHMKY